MGGGGSSTPGYATEYCDQIFFAVADKDFSFFVVLDVRYHFRFVFRMLFLVKARETT